MRFKLRHKIILVVLLAFTCVFSKAGAAQPVETPRARALTQERVNDEGVLYVVTVDTADPNARWGWFVTCDRTNGYTQAGFSFGGFPNDGRMLQVGVRDPSGKVAQFGKVFRSPGLASGYHDPVFEDRKTVQKIVRSVFVQGALVSNGFNSVWNELSAEVNHRVQREFELCFDIGK